MISDLTAACLSIERVVGQTHNHSFHHFAVYLRVLEVYGCGYAEDIDGRGYKIRDSKSHKLSAIKLLQDIQRMYDIVIAQVSDPRHFTVAPLPKRHQTKSQRKLNSSVVRKELLSLLRFQKAHFIKLEQIQQSQTNIPDANVDFANLP